jgi:hypothetical protein
MWDNVENCIFDTSVRGPCSSAVVNGPRVGINLARAKELLRWSAQSLRALAAKCVFHRCRQILERREPVPPTSSREPTVLFGVRQNSEIHDLGRGMCSTGLNLKFKCDSTVEPSQLVAFLIEKFGDVAL